MSGHITKENTMHVPPCRSLLCFRPQRLFPLVPSVVAVILFCVSVARQAAEGALAEEKKILGKHQVLAYAAATKDEKTKKYKQHVKELMSKGAARLTGGKRVRLTSDESEGEKYELNVLTEYIDNDPNLAIVFFGQFHHLTCAAVSCSLVC